MKHKRGIFKKAEIIVLHKQNSLIQVSNAEKIWPEINLIKS